jgi:hypothetical protein
MVYSASAAFSPRGTQLLYANLNSSPLVYNLLAEIKQIDFTGQKLDLADVTNYQSGIFKEWLATLLDSGELTFKGNFIPGDTSQAALLNFFNAANRVNFEVILPNQPNTTTPLGHFTFLAFVQEFTWSLPIEKEGTISGKLKITGPITYTANS